MDLISAKSGSSGARDSRASKAARFAFVKTVSSDLERSTTFYTNVLGLIPSERYDLPHVTELIMRAPDDQGFCLVLCYYKDGRTPVAGNSVGPIGFYVENADEVVNDAVAAGVEISRPSLNFGEWRAAFILDPEGCEIELLSKAQTKTG